MKVKALIKELQSLDQNADVLISSDSEGNSYNELGSDCIAINLRYNKLDYNIDIFNKDDAKQMDMTEEEFSKAKKCIVLFPG